MSCRVLTFLFLLLPLGCSQFYVGRTYLSQMEHDDSRAFNPKEDFPVVAGDTGRYWNTEEEFRARTPASEEEMIEDRVEMALRQELRELENAQLEEDGQLYQQHRHQFRNISENIYFLKLPYYERRDYLIDRGFIILPKQPLFSGSDKSRAIKGQDILMGMRKDDVLESWGKPYRVEIAGNPRNENERWVYQMKGDTKYIYFESGEVQGWE